MCKLCEQEGAKEPVSYSTSATSKLRTHVEKAHIATATAITASEPQEPPEKKIKLTTENIFSVMLEAAAVKKDWQVPPDFKLAPTAAANVSLASSSTPENVKTQLPQKDEADSVATVQQEADATVQMYHPRRGKAPGFVVVQLGMVPLVFRNLPDSVAESLLSSAQRLQRFQMLPARLVLFCT